VLPFFNLNSYSIAFKSSKHKKHLCSVSQIIQRIVYYPMDDLLSHPIEQEHQGSMLECTHHMGRSGGNAMPRNESLRQQRIGRNWRQKDVADQLGTTITAIGRWERGDQQPSAYFRVKLCTLFGKSAQELGLVEAFFSPPESNTPDAAQAVSAPSEENALWTVPYARNPHFTGREELLSQLEQLFAEVPPDQPKSVRQAALIQTQAMTGLGGIGKTQIALEYAYRARVQGRYHDILWIAAASAETIVTSFVELARFLPTLVPQEETNQHTIVAAILRWLEQREPPWLLLVDNADDLSLVQPYLPRQGNGHILLTTRAHTVGTLASSVEVDTMGVMEGTHLLLRRAHRFSAASPEKIDEAINVVLALAQFPLAIDQAGAYIEETGCSLHDYLHIYQQHRSALLARRGKQATSSYPESVATTWSLSFAQVERSNPAAAELLRLCAFLAPDHIPEELLIEGAPYWPPLLQEAVADRFSFNQMLETLLAFSLVKRLSEERMLGIHRLVQAVQMEGMQPQEQRQWAQQLVLAVHATFPRDPEDEVTSWPLCQRYLEQAQACDTLIQEHQLLLPEAAALLNRTGIYLRQHALYTLAEPLYQRALYIREQLLGAEHLDTAQSLSELATLSYQQGKYTQAEQLHQRALHIREQQVGSEHLDTAQSLNELALLYWQLENYEQAEPLYVRALRIRERLLGPDHPKVAETLNNLALLYGDQGNYEQAEPLYVRALRIRERLLGPDHPRVAITLNNLAYLYHRQERYVEAEPLYVRSLRIREQQLGPEHPSLVYALHGLAFLYDKQRRMAEAEPLYQRALHIQERQLETEHLETADVLHDFAGFRQTQGHLSEAASMYQRALTIREHVLGRDSPLTIETRACLHAVLVVMEQTEEAAQPRSTDLLREDAPASSSMGISVEQSAAVADAWSSVHPACPQCRQTGEVLKSGKNRSGSQRFRCRACQLYFTPEPMSREADQVRKAQALALAEQGMSYRRIARQLGVHHQTVSAWISSPST
jgi:tetratricopeptide (TPR) repeat protein/transposase-like protein/transcriptional regulator with XRE-family HTH domain